jgi:hypothetical protein
VRAVPHVWKLYPGICFTTEEKDRKISVRVAELCQLAEYTEQNIQSRIYRAEYTEQNIQSRIYITIRICKHNNKNTQLT